jgi:hypothetical protein
MTNRAARVQYHQLLGSGMQLNLTAVQVFVTTESSILSESPRVDILLLRRQGKAWNEAQRARLPDGVRDSAAAHVLVEFKYTESVTEDGILQAAAYDLFYRQVQRLSKEQTLPVVLSAKTPQKSRLDEWGYQEVQKGVFRTTIPFVGRVMLLALNRLPARTNNAFVKLFASREQEREAGFASLEKSVLAESSDMHAYVLGLRQTLNVKGGSTMAEVLTPEKVLEYGKRIRQLVFETGTPEERLAGLSPDEILAALSTDEILAHLSPDEILARLSPDEILAGLRTEGRRKLLRLLQEEVANDDQNAAGASRDTT